jgi:Holliday junction resolvasome RuvABC endonuclease subunit
MGKAPLGLEATPMPALAADALAVALCLALESPLLQQSRSSRAAA